MRAKSIHDCRSTTSLSESDRGYQRNKNPIGGREGDKETGRHGGRRRETRVGGGAKETERQRTQKDCEQQRDRATEKRGGKNKEISKENKRKTQRSQQKEKQDKIESERRLPNENILEAGLEPAISSLGGRRLIH